METKLLVTVLFFVAVHEAVSQVQTISPVVNNVQNGVDIHDVPVIKEKPKKVIRYKLIRMSDEDIKKEEEAKKQKALQDEVHKEWKKKLFPCKDYSPICGRYKNIWNPGVAQCRDVWMQRNCRESCGLCNVPLGVYLGCNDMQHCKALGSNACVHKWVLETCKTMCGSCDGSKGRQNARVGASSVFVGKKKSLVTSKNEHKVKTVNEAVKNQHKPLETKEHALHKEEDKEDEEEEDVEEQGSGADNMENEGSGQDQLTEESKDESEAKKPEAEEKVVKAPESHKDTPKKIKVAKKPVHLTKIHHHKQHHHKHHHKHHHVKKTKNPIKAIIKKHKKHTKS